MVHVIIEYFVADDTDRSFRPLVDIAKDVEREIWDSSLFCEATDYRIVVRDETTRSIIESKRKENNYDNNKIY